MSNRTSGDAGATGATAISVCVGVQQRRERVTAPGGYEEMLFGEWELTAGPRTDDAQGSASRKRTGGQGGRSTNGAHKAVLNRHEAKCPGGGASVWPFSPLEERSRKGALKLGQDSAADVSAHSTPKDS